LIFLSLVAATGCVALLDGGAALLVSDTGAATALRAPDVTDFLALPLRGRALFAGLRTALVGVAEVLADVLMTEIL
jgi:hypothetical protein